MIKFRSLKDALIATLISVSLILGAGWVFEANSAKNHEQELVHMLISSMQESIKEIRRLEIRIAEMEGNATVSDDGSNVTVVECRERYISGYDINGMRDWHGLPPLNLSDGEILISRFWCNTTYELTNYAIVDFNSQEYAYLDGSWVLFDWWGVPE